MNTPLPEPPEEPAGPAELASLPDRVPVLVAGGGPSGLFLALELAHRGIGSLVIEPRVDVDPHRPRAKTTNARTMTHLRRLGLAEDLRAAAALDARYSEDVIFCSSLTGFEVKRFRHAFQLHRDRFELQPEAGQQVPQPVVETVLRAAARRSDLVTLCTGLSVTSVEGHTVTVSDSEGGTRRVHADFVVGADGGASVVRKSLGIAMQGGSANRSNLNVLFRSTQLAQAVTLDPAVQYWVMSPDASGIIGRADLADRWWAIVQGVDIERNDLDPAALIRAMAGADIDVEVVATDPWTARMLLADSYGRDGVYLIGDAAHLNPPWGGHGFNTCIGDAANLGWKLAATLDGWGGEALLDSYELERRPVAERTIRDAATNGRALANDFADTLLGSDSTEGETLRARASDALEVKRSEFSSLGLVLGYSYAESPLVAADAEPEPPQSPIVYVPSARPGMLLPHAWLADGSSLYDLLDDRGFTLLVAAGAEIGNGLGGSNRHDIPVHTVALDEPTLFARWGAPAVLVRPDQHVAWRGSSASDAATALDLAAGWAHSLQEATP
ncbi:FAD-dependent monooxygenase [Subtercola boreus]|uniref:2-polyprenyl-6-methoxyphenol hydroxylase n=1 Tax=Subtercola boreus TaxID=120213 RepID=A0A3E0WGR9_9MICO|nr:FAD-dependent monooxygenase [Subtercola boreus]RFA23655.1 2-polyprenyl-6-methoxyphenol hydroxylase [Subtercola boreus]RFA24049.1 2-polyprenyl-6-methoxyphenol hydroxylase [Subtercola boreus]RFA29747.1 2-polyprenyl-6-methoxyphenol hydroxylase [Subtercola boreus]